MTTDLKELIERLRSVDTDMNDEYGGGKEPTLFREAADALEAKLCAVVKPLEWVGAVDGRGFIALASYGAQYAIFDEGNPRWAVSSQGSGYKYTYVSDFNTAKAAAQADYEARILSAITIRSASDVAAEARAGAIEAAAGACNDYPRVAPSADEWMRYDEQIAYSEDSIRALHDTDTLAAIEMIKEQARLDGAIEATEYVISHSETYVVGQPTFEAKPRNPEMLEASKRHLQFRIDRWKELVSEHMVKIRGCE